MSQNCNIQNRPFAKSIYSGENACRNKFTEKSPRKPCLDHCHETGLVRGILCWDCNLTEGKLGDIETARRLLAYMEANALFYSAKKSLT